jgi:hypothetical protein
MVVYLLTMCPTVYVEGSGELIGAVGMLGTPHPTGYPLFCLLGRLVVAGLPLASTALEVNVASGLTCALAVTALSGLLQHRGLHGWIAVAAALVLAFSATFWSQAVIAEVYGLSMLAAVVTLGFWARVFDANERQEDEQRWLVAAAFFTGLAVTTHLSQLLWLPGIGLLGLRRWFGSALGRSTDGRSVVQVLLRDSWTTGTKMLGAVLVGYSVILYLPLRSGRGSGFHWGLIDTPAAIWDHTTAALYRSSFSGMPWEGILINAMRFADQMATEFPPLLLAPVGWGLWVTLRRDRTIAWMLGAVFITNLAAALNYHRDPNGLDVFFLPTVLSTVIFLAYGLDDIASHMARVLRRRATLPLLATVVVLGVLVDNYRQADRSDMRAAHGYGADILQSLPPSAVLLTEGDDASFILDYLHRVEAIRPDVTLYNRSGLGSALVTHSMSDRPVAARMHRLAERDLVQASASGGPPVFSLFARSMPIEGGAFEFVPYGLVYQIVPAQSTASTSYPIDLMDVKVDSGYADPWVRKILANYWFMQGEYEARVAWTESARSAYRRAGEIADKSRTMQFNVGRILFLNNELDEALMYAIKAMAIDPLWSHSYRLGVRILTNLGRHDEARSLHKKAVKMGRFY